MSITLGEHPVSLTVIVVQGSTAHLVVPADIGVMAAPSLEFAAENSDTAATVTHQLTQEGGQWVAHLSVAQVAALRTMLVARVKDAGRLVAAGRVDPNAGWEGRPIVSGVRTRIIWGGGGGATTLDTLADVTTTGAVAGQVLTLQEDGTSAYADPPAGSTADLDAELAAFNAEMGA